MTAYMLTYFKHLITRATSEYHSVYLYIIDYLYCICMLFMLVKARSLTHIPDNETHHCTATDVNTIQPYPPDGSFFPSHHIYIHRLH